MHFPGLLGERWGHMARWLDLVEGEEAGEWEAGLEECGYENKTREFWNTVRGVKRMLKVAEIKNGSSADVDHVQDSVGRLRNVLWDDAYDVDLMRTNLDELVAMT